VVALILVSAETVARPRVAVVGAGSFGRNHLRVVHQSPRVDLAGVLDADPDRASQAALSYNCRVFSSLEELSRNADAAVIATPTTTHAEVGCRLMDADLDVLVEKPLAHSPEAARLLVATAERRGRILQVGHLERFNPALLALEAVLTTPLFFEVHRLSEFSPRSLDVDVVLDLMIHDIDIVLTLAGALPEEIRAAGISILSSKVDIANVRLQFGNGLIANLTASRVSTERVRKLRVFQPHEYISLDYGRQDGARFQVQPAAAEGVLPSIGFSPLSVAKDEPLRLELEDFFACIVSRKPPRVTGRQGLAALEVAVSILAKIEEHASLVARTLELHGSSKR
jgi:predicted dehydrogenase